MKGLLFTIFSFLLISTTIAQKAQIESVIQEKYLPNDDGDLVLSLKIEQHYNQYRNLTKEEYFYPNPNNEKELKTDRKRVYSYDSKGRLLNVLEYNGDNILEAEEKTYWNEEGTKTKIENISYTGGQQSSVAVSYLLEYNQSSNRKVEKFYGKDGVQEKERTWYFNQENEIIKSYTWIVKKNHPRKEIEISYKRDSDGDLVKSVTKEKVNGKIYRKDIRDFSNNYVIRWKKYIEGKLESEFVNEYRDSVIIRSTRKNKRKIITLEQDEKRKAKIEKQKERRNKRKKKPGDEIWVTNTEYDAYGNILVTTQSVGDKILLVTQYAYDDYGNKIKTLKINKENNLKEEERLSYDERGSIIKRTLLKNDKNISEDKYMYEYYFKKD
ncbi:MAG: hypothetical protein GY810_12945 [Aureispira sp.]|nr:hypothetical protein [Aureispira sp.]